MSVARPSGRSLALAAVLTLGAGCGGDASGDGPPGPERLARGEAVFHDVCSECHTVDGPENLAPSMTSMARALRREMETREPFVDHVRSYVLRPAEDRSVLGPEVVRRYGAMPAEREVTASQRADVAAWMWTLGGADADAAR